jgi:hypothetical protein
MRLPVWVVESLQNIKMSLRGMAIGGLTFPSPAFRACFPFPCRFSSLGGDFFLPVSYFLVSVIASSSSTANLLYTCVAIGAGLCGRFFARWL